MRLGNEKMWHIIEKMSYENFPYTHLKAVKPVRLDVWDDEIMNVKNILITSGCIFNE